MANENDLKNKIKALQEENNILKQIISHMPCHVYWKNKKGLYLGCNKQMANLFGYKDGAEIVGKNIYDLAELRLAKKVDQADQKIMKGKKEIRLEEEGFDLNKKSAIYLSVKAPIFNQKQIVTGLVGISTDITNIKLAEKALIDAKNKAEEMNRLKSEFIYSVEHDIRAPFSGIHAMSTILARQETDLDKKEALQSIANSSKASLDYATRLLSFAKIEQEFSEINFKVFSLEALIESVIEMQMPAAKVKNLKLITHISPDLPDMIITDADRLKGILINLVNNAIKFTHKGFVKIEVTPAKKNTKKKAKKNKSNFILNFSVADTGIGITSDRQNFIAEKFFQSNPHHQGLYPGFGLGFPVIKKFIHELQGEIKIESSIGKGTRFSFTIPVQISL